MSDTPTPAAADSPQTSTAAPPPAASSPPADTAGGDPFGELPDEPLFPKSYVENLRREGAKYRTEAHDSAQRYAEYDKVYGAYEADDRQVWFDLARTWAVDPNRAAEAMQAIAQSVLGDAVKNGATPEEAAQQLDEQVDNIGALTPEQIQQMIDSKLGERDRQAAEQQAIDGVYDELRSHGYDPETRDGFMVLWTANNETDGDIGAAVQKIKDYRQGIIDEYVAGRSGNHPSPPPTGGLAANETVEIASFEDARKATEAYLRGQRAAGA